VSIGQSLFLAAEFGQVSAAGCDVELAKAGQGNAGGFGQQAVATAGDGFLSNLDAAALGQGEA
jgi:hypothetical protein